jgi:hypothetical protein
MLNVSRSLPDIAVLRGGNFNFKQSLTEGADVMSSLKAIGYNPLDVVIEKDGTWTLGGRVTDAHHVFSRTHTVVDVTHMRDEAYQMLAKKMGVPLLFSQGEAFSADREDVYRILRQQGIETPETSVIRSSAPVKDSVLHKIWTTFHIPLMMRPLTRTKDVQSKLVTGFPEFADAVKEYHDKGVDVHVLTYKKTPTLSIGVLPNFRGEKLYTPLWVETFTDRYELPDLSSPRRPHMSAPQQKRDDLVQYVTHVYNTLGATCPLCIDVIPHKGSYMVVNIESSPSLHRDGRFAQSLATTGVNVGEYIHSRIHADIDKESMSPRVYEFAR